MSFRWVSMSSVVPFRRHFGAAVVDGSADRNTAIINVVCVGGDWWFLFGTDLRPAAPNLFCAPTSHIVWLTKTGDLKHEKKTDRA